MRQLSSQEKLITPCHPDLETDICWPDRSGTLAPLGPSPTLKLASRSRISVTPANEERPQDSGGDRASLRPTTAQPLLAPQAPAEECSSRRPYGKRAGAPTAVAAGVRAATPKNWTEEMTISTNLTRRLGIEDPIMLAPMGFVSGGALAAAVSAAGGFGIIGGGHADPD